MLFLSIIPFLVIVLVVVGAVPAVVVGRLVFFNVLLVSGNQGLKKESTTFF